MAFRKRNVAVGRLPSSPSPTAAGEEPTATKPTEQLPGTRPSPLTSQLITSTGTLSLDGILGGHSGLPLGTSLLIGEHETTDFAGALLKYYAAEGILQGHMVHVVGVGDGWARELPGVAEAKHQKFDAAVQEDKGDAAAKQRMKIAWRYERLGRAGERGMSDGLLICASETTAQACVVQCQHRADR
jgi:elongator complex protein 4